MAPWPGDKSDNRIVYQAPDPNGGTGDQVFKTGDGLWWRTCRAGEAPPMTGQTFGQVNNGNMDQVDP